MSEAERGEPVRSEARDFYSVLGADPSASRAELRSAFRSAVLRYHPDVSAGDGLATRRTTVLNRAWHVLRDPAKRALYDSDLHAGRAEIGEWPLSAGEEPSPPPLRPRGGPLRGEPPPPSPWHQPRWRNVHGFRVPTEIWLAGPAVQRRYIDDHYLAGEDWREHRELYWLRYAAARYREQRRVDDWLGAVERLVELDPSFDTLARAGLRAAYVEAAQYLRGAAFLHRVGARYAAGSPQRAWIDREMRAVLAPFREVAVQRGGSQERAEHAELLLNFLEALELEPSFADYRATIRAHRLARNRGRALELLERLVAHGVEEPVHWFGLIQLLTELGQLDRASALLASIARGDRPEALDQSRLPGANPSRRIAAARERLARARRRVPISA
jgi:hypothetical protein